MEMAGLPRIRAMIGNPIFLETKDEEYHCKGGAGRYRVVFTKP
jgi:hypothetical protein